tara:strand:- start:3947 stop:5995 length:2049 start_codon:yes stop_codon:yes gene_type:complete
MIIKNLFYKIYNENKLNFFLISILIIFLVFFLFNYNNTYPNIFGDRDFLRAKNLLSNFQFYGAEINDGYGLRIPGGFLNYYLFFLTKIFKVPEIIYLVNFLFIIISLLLFSFSISKIFNNLTAIITATLLITSENLFSQLIITWNPTFGFAFYLLSLTFFLNFISTNKKSWLLFTLIFSALAAQFHLTFVILTFFIFVENFFTKRLKFHTLFIYIFIVFFVCYLPFIYKILFLDPSILENYIIYFKDIENITNSHLNLKYFIILFFKSISFVQVSSVIETQIPFFLIVFIIWGLVIANKQSSQIEIRKYKYLISSIIFCLLIIMIFFIYKSGDIFVGVKHRYSMFISPLYALLCAFSLNILFNYYLKIKKNFLLIIFFIFICSFKILIMMGIIYKENKYFFNTNYNILTYKEKYNILEKINFLYNTDSNYLIKNLSFSEIKKKKFVPFNLSMQYILEVYDFEYNSKNKNLENCLLVLYKKDKYRNKIESYEISYLKKIFYNDARILNIENFKNFMFINYKMDDGYCINNVTNHYILTKDEKKSLEKNSLNNSSINIFKNDNSIDYFFNIKGVDNKPIDIYLKLSTLKKNKIISVELISKRLRNSATELNGFWKKTTIVSPKLLLLDKNKNLYSYSFFNGEVGNKITTPLEIKIENDGNINITDMEIFFSYKINNLEKKIKIQ